MRRILFLAAVLVCTFAALGDCLVPQWQVSTYPGLGTWSRNAVASADFDADGRLDIVTIGYIHGGGGPDAVGVFRGQSGGTFSAVLKVYEGTGIYDVAAKDFNGDSKADLLILHQAANTLVFLPGNGDGTFGTAILSTADLGFRLAIGDLTGDGVDDAAGFSSADTLVIYAGNGAGAFSGPQPGPALSGPWLGIAAADLDADGATDLVVSYFELPNLEVFFGNGDCTFDPPAVKPSGTSASRIKLEDADGDADLDILGPNWEDDTVSVHLNRGGRTFDPALVHELPSPLEGFENNPIDVAIGDVTGDGIRDLVVTNINSGLLASLTGTGDGTFGAPSFAGFPSGFLNTLAGPLAAIVDVDGDGRLDVIALPRNHTGLVVFGNRCGDAMLTLAAEPPLVTVGQDALLRVTVAPVHDYNNLSKPTGVVSVVEGDTVVGTASLAEGSVLVSVPGLALGEHTLFVRYAGDDQFEPAQSSTAVVRVTAETTAVTLSTEPATSAYGQEVSLRAHVTASDGTTPEGRIEFGMVGDAARYEASAPDMSFAHFDVMEPGTHQFFAQYRGDASHPRSDIAYVTHVVRKAIATTYMLQIVNTNESRSSARIEVRVNPEFNGAPTGVVQLFDRNVLIATEQLDVYFATFELSGLAPGRHDFHVRYAGDANYESSQSERETYDVFAATGLGIDVRGNAGWINVNFTRPADAIVRIARTVAPNQNFTNWVYPGTPPMSDGSVSAGIVYLYQAESRDPQTNVLLATSVIDLGVRSSFNDDPLLAGMSIRSSHLQEIVAATNFLRGKAGQSLVSFNDIAAGQPIRASHVTTLRTRINEARVALGAAPYSFTNAVSPAFAIRAQDLQELREAVH